MDYTKQAIARSVERARAEAEERAKIQVAPVNSQPKSDAVALPTTNQNSNSDMAKASHDNSQIQNKGNNNKQFMNNQTNNQTNNQNLTNNASAFNQANAQRPMTQNAQRPQMQNARPQSQQSNSMTRTPNVAQNAQRPQLQNARPQMQNARPQMQNARPQMQNARPQMQNAQRPEALQPNNMPKVQNVAQNAQPNNMPKAQNVAQNAQPNRPQQKKQFRSSTEVRERNRMLIEQQKIKEMLLAEQSKETTKTEEKPQSPKINVMPSFLSFPTKPLDINVQKDPFGSTDRHVATQDTINSAQNKYRTIDVSSKPQPVMMRVGEQKSLKQPNRPISAVAPNGANAVSSAHSSARPMGKLQEAKLRKKEEQLISSNEPSDKLKIIFLGGVGEIGKNMTLFEYAGDIICVDCGLTFPGGDMPGIDLVIPDMTYLKENAARVKAYLITHAHEDHIGALPFALRDVNAPVYSGRLSLAMLENKLKERNLKNVNLQAVSTRRKYQIGKFEVEFVDVNHSIADSLAIYIKTPAAKVFVTGDFKIDFEPIDGKMIDLPRIAEIGREGVDLMLCESTNVEQEGYTLSESSVGRKLDEVFDANRDRRIFVATFSSNVYRVQQVLELAVKYGRKVALIGRSMLNNLEAAIKVEKLNFPKQLFVDIEKANKYEDKEIMILCTGSQGESNAALSRLASGEYTKAEIGKNDTVIFSSSPIPGNESNINKVINNLYRKGAIVIHENVHASGHACIEELKTMHSLVKPNFFIPVHGEYRHLKKHQLLALSMGMPEDHIVIVDLGDMVEVSSAKTKIIGKVKAGETLIDGYGMGDVDSDVLKERKILAEEGLVVVVIGINSATNTLASQPIVITRGCVYDAEEEKIVEEAKGIVVKELMDVLKTKKVDWEEAKQILRKPLRSYFLKKTNRAPIILPVIYKI